MNDKFIGELWRNIRNYNRIFKDLKSLPVEALECCLQCTHYEHVGQKVLQGVLEKPPDSHLKSSYRTALVILL